MKTRLIFTAIIISLIALSCKKEKKTAPPTPSPSPVSVTAKVAIADYTSCSTGITAPRITAVFVSPTGVMGDTLSDTLVTVWGTVSTFPSTDAAAMTVYNNYPSATFTFSLLDDGSYYRLYVNDGTNFKRAYRVYTSGLSGDSGAYNICCSDYVGTSTNVIVVGW